VQIGVALEHVAIFRRDLVGLEIGQAGHAVSLFAKARSGKVGTGFPKMIMLK
jgi:hypothetical protein